jgi:hypothetical protein
MKISPPNIIIASLLLSAGTVLAQDVPDTQTLPRAFFAADLPEGATPHRQSVVFQPTTIDTAMLATLKPGDWVALNVAPTRTFAGLVAEIRHRGEGRFTISGTLDGLEETTFVIAVQDEAVAGTFQSPTTAEHYKLKYTGVGGTHLVCQIDPSKYGKCAGAIQPPPRPVGAAWLNPVDDQDEAVAALVPVPADEDAGFDGRGSCPTPQTIFDGMVAYSDNVRVAMGGTNAVLAEIELTQTVTNEVYQRSGVAARYRVVWVGEVNYAQTNDGDTDLDQLADGSDGILDSLHTIRDNENADFVTLWLTNIGPDLCGIAYCTPSASDAFNVVVWDCAADNFSHPHEIGHNQGCDHNDGDGTLGCGEFDYSLGYRFFGSDNRGYRTVMAYDNDNNTYTRIGYFSTPNRSFMGRNVGTAGIDNTRSINNTRAQCEAFQFSRVEVYVDFGFAGLQYGTFANPYASFASAVAVSRQPASSALTDDEATIFVKPGTGSYAGTITKRMWIRACAGTANIGGNP